MHTEIVNVRVSICDEEDTVYEMVRKRQIIDKVKSGFRRQVENVGSSQDEEWTDEEQACSNIYLDLLEFSSLCSLHSMKKYFMEFCT